MKQVVYGDIRIQLLSEEIVRIEYGQAGKFCDENTFFIPNKKEFERSECDWQEKRGELAFGDYKLTYLQGSRSLKGVKITRNGEVVYTYKRIKNSGELPPPDKTPEVFALCDTPRIVVPEGGYTYRGRIKNSGYTVEEGVEDVYLLLCKKDAKKLRKLFVELTGRNELVRLSTLGGWNSKYYAYDEKTARELILDYERHKVPLDVMVIDTDWRASSDRGIGYDIDKTLFPSMKRFMNFAHAHGVEIMFNDHPEPVEGARSVLSPSEVRYREKKLTSLHDVGLDMWWYDRNWHTKLISPVEGVESETWGLHIFHDVTENYLKKIGGENYLRPVIMGNVNNVVNGIYESISDSASHRYSIQWTGDIASGADDLALEVENLVRCTNNCIAYVNSDCGGHTGNPDKEGFIRWMQYGALSPVFRPHCTKFVERYREPWAYDEETLGIVREYNNLRYRLLPVIYKNAYENYATGEPIFKSLGFEYPEDKKAAARCDEYMLGNNLLISPIAGDISAPVAKSAYVTPVKATFYNGRELQGAPIAQAEWKELYMSLNDTAPAEGVPVYDFSARFETTLLFGKEKNLFIKSDDGVTVYLDGVKVLEDKTLHGALQMPLGKISANEPHKIVVEYFQANGAAYCGLFATDVREDDKKQVYLPAGEWIDAFDGKIYAGGKLISKEYPLRAMPLFIRRGALLPLAHEAKNTKEQKWNRLVYDLYPSKTAGDCGYLYEDDTQTIAYRKGEYRKSAFRAGYCPECNALKVALDKSVGTFGGEKAFAEREIVLRYHLLAGTDRVVKVTVNGAETEFNRVSKDAESFPMNADGAVPDADVLLVNLHVQTDENYEICFYLA